MTAASARHRSGAVFATVQAPRPDWLARAEPEDVIDPDLPIIDAHLHLWKPPNGLRYYIEEHAEDLRTCGHRVVASVYAECFHMYRSRGPSHMRYIGETEFAVGQAAMADSGELTDCRVAAAIIGHADLTLGERTLELLHGHIQAGNGRFRGVRQLGKWDSDPAIRGTYCAQRPHLYLDAAFGQGVDMLTSLGLSLDASVFHPQLGEVASLARAHPDANIVLIHCGSPVGHGPYAGKEDKVQANWLAGMKDLARCPNVSVKMGGILINLANFDFSTAEKPPTSSQLAELWRPYIEPCVELFGAGRCMVSSNFPVDKVGFGYATVWNMFKRLTQACSADEKSLMFGGTAQRVYRIPDLA